MGLKMGKIQTQALGRHGRRKPSSERTNTVARRAELLELGCH